MKRLGLDGLEERRPYQLSGGQRQRVALARAVVNQPEVIFVDEPTASLDRHTSQAVLELLGEFAQKACVILVTHDELILRDATAVYRMRDGRISS